MLVDVDLSTCRGKVTVLKINVFAEFFFFKKKFKTSPDRILNVMQIDVI